VFHLKPDTTVDLFAGADGVNSISNNYPGISFDPLFTITGTGTFEQ